MIARYENPGYIGILNLGRSHPLFLEPNKIFRVAGKNRVGRETGNIFFGLTST